MEPLSFTVLGTPAPQGSKVRTRFGMREDNPATKPWRQDVAWQAREAYGAEDPYDGPVHVTCLFVFARPKAHYRTGKHAGELRPDAPAWCDRKPDADKLARAIGDALSSIVVRDDSRIVAWSIEKRYGAPARCDLTITPVVQLAAVA